MSNFVYDGPALPSNASSSDVINAINSLREAILSGKYHGLGLGKTVGISQAGEALVRNVGDALQASVNHGSFFSIAEKNPGVINVRDFGAKGDGVTDDLPAFQAALAEMKPVATNPPMSELRGRTLFIPPGIYKLAGSLTITKTCILEGAGSNFNASSVLKFPANSHGIVLHGWGTSPTGARADSVQIHNLEIVSDGPNLLPNQQPSHGILAMNRFHLENVRIHFFTGNGIHVAASTAAGANANGWSILNVRVDQCGGHGMYLNGTDANAGVAILLDCSDNQGWGIYDSSFLGNTYIACHTANNAEGAYTTDDVNQDSVFLGCYSEMGQKKSKVVNRSMIIGGQHGAGVEEQGNYHLGARISPFSSLVAAPTGSARISVGTRVPGAAYYLGFWKPGGFEPLHLYRYTNSHPYISYRGDWTGFNWAYLDAGWSMLLPMDGYTSKIHVDTVNNLKVEKRARLCPAFPSGGFYWGLQMNWFGGMTFGGPPTSGTWEAGDIVMNSAANIAGKPWSGWIGGICISDGTSGTYNEGLLVTADGTNIVVLSGASTALTTGQVLTVNGVDCRIVDISGTQVTLTQSVPAGSSLPIAFKNPTWKRFGALEP